MRLGSSLMRGKLPPVSSAHGAWARYVRGRFDWCFTRADATGGAFRHDWDRLHSGVSGPLHDVELGRWGAARELRGAANHRSREHRCEPSTYVRRDGSIPTDSPARPGLLVFGFALAITSGSLAVLHATGNQSLAVEVVVLVVANLGPHSFDSLLSNTGYSAVARHFPQQRQGGRVGCFPGLHCPGDRSLAGRGRPDCIFANLRPHGYVLSA